MKITLSNLGPLKQAEFELGDMTIICGMNNSGKTYAAYALFGFLSLWRELLDVPIPAEVVKRLLVDGAVRIDLHEYVEQAETMLERGCRDYAKQLPMVFAAPPDRFTDTVFGVRINTDEIRLDGRFERKMRAAGADLFSLVKESDRTKLVITFLMEKERNGTPADAVGRIISDAVKDIIFAPLFPNPFIAVAERTGAAIFRRELNMQRSRLSPDLTHADKTIGPMQLLLKLYPDYSLPVKTNVEFTRGLEEIAKKQSFISETRPDALADFADIIGGGYSVTAREGLCFIPKGKRVRLSMDESSGGVRSLVDFGFYLRHVAQPGDLLMVDEPELNLHPENQRRIARLFAKLLNLGVKVFITTHSDYLIKEFNTLIMLNHDKPYLKRIMDTEGYKPDELLAPSRVKAYIAEEALVSSPGAKRRTRRLTLTPADVDPELGIEARSFDRTIADMNRIQEDILFGGEDSE